MYLLMTSGLDSRGIHCFLRFPSIYKMAEIKLSSNSDNPSMKYDHLTENSVKNSESDRGRQIIVMTVNVKEGLKDQIVVHEADDPLDLAEKFTQKHNLDKKFENLLVKQITHEIEVLIQEEENTHIDLSQTFASSHKNLNPIYQRINEQNNNSKAISGRSSDHRINFGEKLYIKDLQRKEIQENRIQKFIKLKEAEEKKELTFHPQINRFTVSSKSFYSKKPEESLLERDVERQKRLTEEVEKKLAKEKSECPFSPAINQKSKKMIKRHTRDKFRELFEEARFRTRKREVLSAEA